MAASNLSPAPSLLTEIDHVGIAVRDLGAATLEYRTAFGVEPAHVRRIESAAANPSLAILISIAKALDLTVSELLA